MNVTDSIDINTLLQWLLRDRKHRGADISEENARDAAARLITRANTRLSAGLTHSEVLDLWTMPLLRRKR